MKRLTTILLAVAIALGARCSGAEENRIGTFDRVSIVVAYYRSSLWDETVRKQRLAQAKAKKANDIEKMREMTAWEKKSRLWAHEQVEKGAPIKNVLEALKPAFETIKKDVKVSDVVVSPAADTKAEAVDVTDKLLEWLKADDDTRKVIAEYKKK